MAEKLGPEANRILSEFVRTAKAGEHILVNGDTGSGKTSLVPYLTYPRYQRGGSVIVFVMKPTPDKTIVNDFKSWTRWKRMKKHPLASERRILLWPDVKGMKPREAMAHQREVFAEALDMLYTHPGWTIVSDESLYLCAPEFMGLAQPWALHNFQGRSMGNTIITLTQRPSHLPVVVYGSCTHAFIGRTNEQIDLKRLSQLNGKYSSKLIGEQLSGQDIHDFLYIRKGSDDPVPPVLNLRR